MFGLRTEFEYPRLAPLGRALWRIEARARLSLGNFGSGRRRRIFNWMRGTHTDFGASILEVGCGRGKLLHELRLFGFEHLTGADPFVSGELRYDNGVVVHQCELSKLDQRFDLIMMHHTFEHVPDPRATLAAARERLNPGKSCCCACPWSTVLPGRSGVNWFALDAPRHLYLHSPASIRLLAELEGFTLANVEWDSGAHQFWGSEQYSRDIPHRSPSSHEDNPKGSIFTRRELREYERKSRELNAAAQGDSACFYLRRD